MIIADKLNKYRDYYVPASALPQRTSAPNLRAEAAAACELSRYLAEDPSMAVRHMLDTARHLSGANEQE